MLIPGGKLDILFTLTKEMEKAFREADTAFSGWQLIGLRWCRGGGGYLGLVGLHRDGIPLPVGQCTATQVSSQHVSTGLMFPNGSDVTKRASKNVNSMVSGRNYDI